MPPNKVEISGQQRVALDVARVPTAAATPTSYASQLKLCTWNVRGLYKSSTDVAALLTEDQPDVLVLTETKMRALP